MQSVLGRVGVSRARKGKVMIEQIEWFKVDEQMPDAGVTVLMRSADGSESDQGHYDDEFDGWWVVKEQGLVPSRYTPTYWAEWPKGPTQ